MTTPDLLFSRRLVPVVVLDDPGRARPLAQALAAGGLPVAEVTFRTPHAGQVLSVMAEDPAMMVGAGTVISAAQVDAAVAAGTRAPMIVLRHILPNTLAPMTVQATYVCASAMIVEAILSFIGAGTPPTVPSWGNIMAEGRALWQVKPYIVFFPAAFLSVTVLAVNLLGDGLRDALDPRMAKRL